MLDYCAKNSLLEQLSENVRSCLLANAQTRCFARGSTISLQGEHSNYLKIVQSGWVKLYRVSQSGEETVLDTLHQGQSFHEIASLQRDNSPTSVEAVSDCSIMFIDLSSACSCDGAYREITSAVMTAASNHHEALLTDIETLKIKTGSERLLEYLLDLASASDCQNDFVLPFGKTVLAGKLGMKPESLSRAFARLKPFGVLSDKRRVTIRDISMLESVSNGTNTYA